MRASRREAADRKKIIEAARSDVATASVCLTALGEAIRTGQTSDEADAGAVILADALHAIVALGKAYLK